MASDSPSAGKFAKGEIFTGINGTALEGLNPFVAVGNALTKAEATDGRMVFRRQTPEIQERKCFHPNEGKCKTATDAHGQQSMDGV